MAALRAMFTKNRTEITLEQVVQELVADPDAPWHEYRGRGPITKNQVAALLRDYDIRPVVIHPTKRADLSRHGYRAAQFDDAFARFLPDEPNIRTLKARGDVMFGCSDVYHWMGFGTYLQHSIASGLDISHRGQSILARITLKRNAQQHSRLTAATKSHSWF